MNSSTAISALAKELVSPGLSIPKTLIILPSLLWGVSVLPMLRDVRLKSDGTLVRIRPPCRSYPLNIGSVTDVP